MFAQTPANRIGDIALAATVWSNDRGNARAEGEIGLLGESFESFYGYTFYSKHLYLRLD